MSSSGIGITTEISSIEWMAENERYPAEPKYTGVLRTYAGTEFPFISDFPVSPSDFGMKVMGRLVTQNGRNVIEIAEVTPIRQ